MSPGARRWGAVAAGGVLAAVVAAVTVARVQGTLARRAQHATIAAAIPGTRGDGFVGSAACKACHPSAYATWHDTYHRTMTQPASAEAMLGRFDGVALDDGTVPERDDEGYWFREGDARRQVVMVTGSHHMQVYWHAADDGSLQSATWAWLEDPAPGRFVPNEATLLRPPGEPTTFTWNRVCIKCHAVAGNPGWDEATAKVDSEVAELGIACEACHGPGAAHVQVHRDPLHRYAAYGDDAPDPTIVHPGRLDAAASSEVCGQCHSISIFVDEAGWTTSGRAHALSEPLAHAPLSTWARVARHPLRADQPWIEPVLEVDADFLVDRFWYDGMVRVSGREYNGMIESACFGSGELSCLSCHSMHDAAPDDQLRAEAIDESVCTGCHRAIAADVHSHAHHTPAQASCMDCHMPHTTYGLLKGIRSHHIDVPSVAVAQQTGRPTACALCHLDATPRALADALTRWYDHPPAPEETDAIVAAGQGVLAGDAGQRALWAWHLGWSRAQGSDALREQLFEILADDPYAAVRLVAERARATRASAAATLRPATYPLDAATIEAWLGQRDERPIRLAE